jgi:hypothetical protein
MARGKGERNTNNVPPSQHQSLLEPPLSLSLDPIRQPRKGQAAAESRSKRREKQSYYYDDDKNKMTSQ